MAKLLSVALLIAAALGMFGYVKFNQVLRNPIGKEATQAIILEVTPNMKVNQVLDLLESKLIISNKQELLLVSKILRLGSKLKVGEYEINPQMTGAELFLILQSGKSIGRVVTIPEGYNIFEIAKIFEAEGLMSRAEFITYVTNPQIVSSLIGEIKPSLEGYLFPESYQVTKKTTGKELIKNMVQLFKSRYQPFEQEQSKLGWSRHQVLTLASIVEKETGAPWERPLIAAVFHNRIQKKMKLQTDPTVLYAKALDTGNLEIRIGRKDLDRAHPYNTYHIGGLPPGPIANPGLEAIKSVFNPEPGVRYLYFVSKNDGTHVFSETYEQHNKAVQDYQKNAKAREGRSWRELNSKLKKPAQK